MRVITFASIALLYSVAGGLTAAPAGENRPCMLAHGFASGIRALIDGGSS